MKNEKLAAAINVFLVSVWFFLVGCKASSSTPTPSEGDVSTDTPIVIVTETPTRTPVVATREPITVASPTPTATSTQTLTPTVEPTPTETPFVIPTPPGKSVTEQVLWLFETNNGCQLPCWWGITPGKTKWETAEKILILFDPNIYTVSASGLDYYSPAIPLPPEAYEIGNAYASNMYPGYIVRNGIVEEIFTEVSIGDTPPGYLTPYILSTFLTTNGQPSEVWLFTYPSPFEGNDLPFVVVLFYEDKGITALYSDNGTRQGDLVHGCPQEDPVSFLSLWPPGLHLTFEDAIKGTSALVKRLSSFRSSN